MWLPWYYALVLCVGFAGVGAGAANQARLAPAARSWPVVRDLAAEATRVAGLYALWNFGGRLSFLGTERARDRGRSIAEAQEWLGVPSERELQALFLNAEPVIQAANVYYAVMHVPMMGVLLLWLFLRHRPSYSSWRNRLVAITMACLVLQLVPVAPPRLIPVLGVVDTGATVGPSVYAVAGESLAGQATAMPSLHVAWAALVAAAMWSCGSRRVGRLGLAHLVATVWVVTVTGHHFWADGAVAVVLLTVIVAIDRRIRAVRSATGTAGGADPKRTRLTLLVLGLRLAA